jgi:hypothetical protein
MHATYIPVLPKRLSEGRILKTAWRNKQMRLIDRSIKLGPQCVWVRDKNCSVYNLDLSNGLWSYFTEYRQTASVLQYAET